MLRVVVLLTALASCRETPTTPKKPTITRLVPEQVTTKGYRLGSIEGDNFDTKAPVKVWFGSTPATRAAVIAKTKIQVEMPPGTEGTAVDVRVELEGYPPALSPMKLRYISAGHGSGDHEHGDEAEEGSAP